MKKNHWNPMNWDSLDLPAYTEVWVTDGKQTVLAQVERRFGTPLSFYMNDNGELMKHIRSDVPKWLHVNRFSDMEAPENFCSSGPLPRDEIDFMPTHWMVRETKPSPP